MDGYENDVVLRKWLKRLINKGISVRETVNSIRNNSKRNKDTRTDMREV